MDFDVVIAGAGQAAAQLALSLRQRGFEGSVAMIGDEAYPPYERPPLSKEYLSGDKDRDQLMLRKPEAWAERDITLQLGRHIDAVDPAGRRLKLGDGGEVGYGHLVWATGGRVRRINCPGAELAGVHYVRNIADVDRLRAELGGTRRCVVIGGGYIGLESAAVLRKLGHSVTVLEMQDRLLARVTSPVVSDYYARLHRDHGVEIRLNVGVAGLRGDRHVEAVMLADGSELAADIVIVGIGIIPNVEPLAAAALDCPNGVRVDEYCRSSDPRIFAIGDCAFHKNPFAEQPMRVESVQNAVDQAKTVAGVLVGEAEPYQALPWFWSNQYDVKLQTVGLAIGYDRIVVRGDPETASFTACYLRGGRLIALDCVGTIKDFIQGKKLVAEAAMVDPARLADASVDLKALLAA